MKHLLALVFLLFVLVPVMGQDATEAATVEAGQVTVIDGTGSGDTNITVESPETPAPAPVEQKPFLTSILEFVLGAIVGAGLALGSAAAWIKSAMNDPVKMTLAESAARSISPETLKQVLDFLDTSRAFVVEASDGVPMVTKQASANTGFTSTMTQSPSAPMP
jgi:hypothetical protein